MVHNPDARAPLISTRYFDANGNEIPSANIQEQFINAGAYWTLEDITGRTKRYFPNEQGLPNPNVPPNSTFNCGSETFVAARDNAADNSIATNAAITNQLIEDYETQLTNATAGMSCEESWEWEQMFTAKEHIKDLVDKYDDAWVKSAVSDTTIDFFMRDYAENGGTLKRAIQAAKESGYGKLLSVGYESFIKEMIPASNYNSNITDYADIDDNGNYISGFDYGVPPVIEGDDEFFNVNYCKELEERRGSGASNEDEIDY